MTIPSIIAHSHGINGQPTPEVGMGVTQIAIADKYPYTVTKVLTNKKIEVKPNRYQADKNKECKPGHQNWLIETEPISDCKPITLTLRKNGWWVRQGQSMNGSSRWMIGVRQHYYCWEF